MNEATIFLTIFALCMGVAAAAHGIIKSRKAHKKAIKEIDELQEAHKDLWNDWISNEVGDEEEKKKPEEEQSATANDVWGYLKKNGIDLKFKKKKEQKPIRLPKSNKAQKTSSRHSFPAKSSKSARGIDPAVKAMIMTAGAVIAGIAIYKAFKKRR